MNKMHKPYNKLFNTRNAAIAVILMLILLLSLQAPVCCDGVITTGLTLPAPIEQPQRPAQLPPVPTNTSVAKSVVKPIASKTEAVITPPAIVEATAEPSKTELPESVIVTTKTTPEIELAAIAPAAAPVPDKPAAQDEGIMSDAATTLASVLGSGFVKIASSGEKLEDSVTNWECVEDKSNNLVWEVKKDDGSIRDRDYSYSWLRNINGENIGVSDGGRCKGGVNCDTSSYVQAMNTQKLCGYSDWRLPTMEELELLVEYNDDPKQATINQTYFPQAIPSWYWTASEHQKREGYAWYVLFRNGVALNDLKERPKHIRLVRGDIKQ